MNMKKLFEQSMWDLLERKSIGNITVNMLVEQVGSCKGTFYKYYLDKFDLCCACLKNRLYDGINTDGGFEEFCASALDLFRQNATVVRHAFDSDEINSVRHYHEQLTAEILYSVTGISADGTTNAERVCVESYARNVTTMTVDWLCRNCKESAADLLSYITAVAPHRISERIYEKTGGGALLKNKSAAKAGKAAVILTSVCDGQEVVYVTADYIGDKQNGKAVCIGYTVAAR